jgi:hypothetical protein
VLGVLIIYGDVQHHGEIHSGKVCISIVCFGEKEVFQNHLQMVCKIYISSFVALNKLIKKCLGWDDVNNAPPRQHVHCKILRGVGMHTHTSIIGFCLKDQKEEHFQFCYKNVNAKEMQDGVDEFVQYGSCFNKNNNNIMERATTFCKYKMKKIKWCYSCRCDFGYVKV